VSEKDKTDPKPKNLKTISRRAFAVGSMAVIGAYSSFSQEPPPPISAAAKALKLEISDQVKSLLDDRHILEEDVRRVIEHGEKTGLKLYQPGTDRFLSKLRIFEALFYVEYSFHDGVYRIHTAYNHRFKLEQED
jgi:hypothetical protein